jgi:hypothetical protein
MQKRYIDTEKLDEQRSGQIHVDFWAAAGSSNRNDSKKRLILYTKLNIRSIVPILIVSGFFLFLLLIPLSRSEAQASDWTPAWAELGDSEGIHVIGLEVDPQEKIKPSNSAANQEPEKHGVIEPIKELLSSLQRSFSSLLSHVTGWTTIFSDELEGAFPGGWNVFDNNGSEYGEYHWAKKNCQPYAGDYSAWVVGGGADGSALPCDNLYPNDVQSWMVYGPFSLEEATDAEFVFMYWLNSEPLFDEFFIGASINGTNFYGEVTSGYQDWSEKNFDLTDVYTLGDLTSQPAVWVAIAFQSDESINSTEGAYVDNIEIRQFVEGEPTPPVTPVPGNETLYLPLVTRNFPLIPTSPVLNPISNNEGDGSYTVSWSSSMGATTYTLEEDDHAGFSSPTTVYSGGGLSKAINGRQVGTYYYRVRASNSYGSSDWSNVESVQVTVPPPECPQVGEWSGTTSQGGSIHFHVENSAQCQVTSLSISAHNCFSGEDYFVPTTWPGWVFPVIDSSFTTGPGAAQVTGNFGSLTTAEGVFSVKFIRPNPYPWECFSTGTWTAHP